ncbi:XRE family transcriptional regulator [Kibdelosporangium aridum]|uniref:XRE family transcriptional regulator n=1 Tax=Kibdelosporangium aridum TaxID=2030 RepID=A0A428YA66_KIBAR|nr:helix-turn-helix transcriptional regulator [Kibdelosporangium aridum]RSM64485.1 XRE family transcriptional regulator [Kibdelosporangium aridum]
MGDLVEFGGFLRARREALRPADVGLSQGSRRRTPGLRREEVAGLASISADYYERLEQARGVRPSEQVVASVARALRLSTDERDHLFVLAGYRPPARFSSNGFVDPGLMHLLDALVTTPAQITDDVSTVVAQNPLAVALVGQWAQRSGRDANVVWRWFTDLSSRELYPVEQHAEQGRCFVADLRWAAFQPDRDDSAQRMVADLLACSAEFAGLWESGDVEPLRSCRKVMTHPRAGRLEMQCDVVLSPGTGHRLVMFRPQPGTETAERIDFLRVLGTQELA